MAPIDAVDPDHGSNALHLAILHNHREMVEVSTARLCTAVPVQRWCVSSSRVLGWA